MSNSPTPWIVQVHRADGAVLTVRLLLPKKPIRQAQKLKTLTQYVKRYPSGWKKRLALADLRYEMGHWEEAILDFRWVLNRQPNLRQGLSVRLKLGKMLELLERPAEAIAVYQDALARITYQPTRQVLQEAIALCQQAINQAAISQLPRQSTINPRINQAAISQQAPYQKANQPSANEAKTREGRSIPSEDHHDTEEQNPNNPPDTDVHF